MFSFSLKLVILTPHLEKEEVGVKTQMTPCAAGLSLEQRLQRIERRSWRKLPAHVMVLDGAWPLGCRRSTAASCKILQMKTNMIQKNL
jgi:hypothetical protein